MHRKLSSMFIICTLGIWHLGCGTESQSPETGEATDLPASTLPIVDDPPVENGPDPLQAIKGEMAGKLKQFLTERTTDFAERFQVLVLRHDDEIDELERRAGEMGQAGYQKWIELRPTVERQHDVLMTKLQQIKEAGPSEWPRLKDEFLSALTQLKSAIDRAKAELEPSEKPSGNQVPLFEKSENPKTQQ